MRVRRGTHVITQSPQRTVGIRVEKNDSWLRRTLLVLLLIVLLLLLLAQTGVIKWRTTVPGSSSQTVVKGTPGRNGTDGKDGAAGVAGKDGSNGKNGVNGRDGVIGKDGAPGLAGAPGTQGPQGPPGPGITLGDGMGTVGTCDDDVEVHLRSYWNQSASPAGFFVESISLSNVAVACDGKTMAVVLTDGSDTPLVTLSDVPISLTSGTFTMTGTSPGFAAIRAVRSVDVSAIAFEITN